MQEGLLPDGVETVPAVEIPKDTANGDYTTTFCLAASKAMRKNPREVANILTQHMKLDGTYFTSVEIAGPGFLNFRLGEKWYADVVEDVEREDSENPVYYIQYAYARICSLLKTMADEGRSVPAADKADLSLLSGEQERALIKELANFSEEIRMAARDYDPSYINRYLMRLAGAFHRFYNACRIKGETDDVAIII